MIGFITGKVIDASPQRVLVSVGGVGFIIHSTINTLGKQKVGKETNFWTHTAVRENDISLYGFETEEELIMFEKLISVSGIGPKSALALLSVAGLKNIEDAIISGNTSILTKISGVGKKTADKLVLELSGKVATHEMSEGLKDDLDVFEALRALGYREHEVKDVIKNLPQNLSGANEKIKGALKMLGKN
ncbi:MAG TPA: Holliday junction branch migration protein RuvA [Candidatus Paceibacterota bacterium]